MENSNKEYEIDKRLPKQFGDFAEMFVMYLLGKYKNMRVAHVDHIGADIIATDKQGKKYAISVKGRNIPDNESKSTHFDNHNICMLKDFSDSFDMTPLVAFVIIDNIESLPKLRVFIVKLETLMKRKNDVNIKYISESKRNGKPNGFSFSFGSKALQIIKDDPEIDYTEIIINQISNELKI